MKNRIISICLVFAMLLMLWPHTIIRAEASGVESLSCSSFISNTAHQEYIDLMMQYYISANSKLMSALDNGQSVVFMFEGGSDNYSSAAYSTSGSNIRNQAVVIVVQRVNGSYKITFYSENCSSIPSQPQDTSGGSCDRQTTILDGIYKIQTCNHQGKYGALNVITSTGYYTPSSNPDGWTNSASGINIHTRSTQTAGSGNSAWSWGCQLIGSGGNADNVFNNFMKAVAGINYNVWTTYPSSLATVTAGKSVGYYVVDRQLALTGLNALYTETALANITASSRDAYEDALAAKAPITISSNIVDLTMRTGHCTTITLTKSGHVENGCYYDVWLSEDIATISYLGWNGDDFLFNVIAHTPGSGYIVCQLYDLGTDDMIDYCTIPIQIAANSYTITYNANGGSGAPSAQTKTEGIGLTLSGEIPIRFGYNFRGWALSSSATQPDYLPGDTYWNDASVTLHAVWEEAPVIPSTTGYEHVNAGQIFSGTGCYYQFTPTVSGYYRVVSQTPALDLIAILYDADGDMLKVDIDGGAFLLDYYLNSGETYYIRAGLRSSVPTEPFDFGISKASYITYNANGGSGAPSGHFVYYGNDAYLSSTIPTRKGYTFCGWSTDPNATCGDYLIPAGFWVYLEEDTTLYAVWEVNAAGVIYDANGGSGAPGEQWMNYGDTFELYGDIPSRFGYNFLGWGTSSNATSATYQPGDTITLTGNLYLYAVWEKAKVLETPETYTAESITGTVIQPYTGMYYQLNCTETANYMFSSLASGDASNWLTVFDSRGNEIPCSGTNPYHDFWLEFSLAAGEIYYIRVGGHRESGSFNFRIYHGARITYDANGGAYAPDTHWIYFGTGGMLSTDIPWRDGYNFLGWATSADATAAEYQPGDAYHSNVDVTLYAVWEHVTYDLIYDLDGGTNGPESVNIYGKVTIPDIIPEKLGSNFLGWTIGWGNIDYQPGDRIFVDGNMTLWAVWEEKMVEDVSYYGAVSHTAEILWPGVGQYYIFIPGSTGTYRIADLSDEERTDILIYDQSGFCYAGGDGFSYVGEFLANQTYYLRLLFDDTSATGTFDFLVEKAYTVTYDANGGSGAPESKLCYHATGMTVSRTVPIRDGYSFLGWSEHVDAEEAEYVAGDSFLTSQNTTLYAVWKKTEYTITFDANGGENAPEPHNMGTSTWYTVDAKAPHRLGYTFLGWSTDPNATEAEYRWNYDYKVTDSVTFYAVWKNQELTSDSTNGYSFTCYYPTPIYYTFVPDKDCHYRFSVSSLHESVISVLDADGNDLVALAVPENDRTNRLFCAFKAGETYYIRIDLFGSDTAHASISLYQRQAYIITYDMNDGSGLTEVQYKEHSWNYTISETIPTRTGYVFLGWATSNDAVEPEYLPGKAYPYAANADATLYAVWKQEKPILYGDVNGDGNVNTKDRMVLTRYLAGMTGYTADMIDMKAADVNCDGTVNAKDRMILTRYLAQWTAYPALPHVS